MAKWHAQNFHTSACQLISFKRWLTLHRAVRNLRQGDLQILKARDKELQGLAVNKYLDALCVFLWQTTPILMSFVTFGIFTLMGHKLNATVVFTSLALFNLLIVPLNCLPWVITTFVEASVSLRRLERYALAFSYRKNMYCQFIHLPLHMWP